MIKLKSCITNSKNAATQIVRTQQFLPLAPIVGGEVVASDYIFEPSKEEIVLTLIPKSLKLNCINRLEIRLQQNTERV